jgi:hypothetical protein
MDKLKKSLELLDKFFNENSENYIEEKLDKIDKINIQGETLDSYIENFHENFNYESKIDTILSTFDINYESLAKLEWHNFYQNSEKETAKIVNTHCKKFNTNIPSGFTTGNGGNFNLAA